MGADSSKHAILVTFGDDDDDILDLILRPSRKRQEKGPQEKQVAQFRPLTAKQVKNRYGGYSWEVDDMMRLQRFIFLGADNSFSYNVTDQELKRENATCVDRLIAEGRGPEVVDMIRNISLAGRAAKQQPTLFALAICCRCNDVKTKQAAYGIVNEVCRIPTHLFLFVKYCEMMSSGTGWGRAHKAAIQRWYQAKAESPKGPKALARLVTKYRRREDWSHRDLFRLSHLKPKDDGFKVIARFVIRGFQEAKALADEEGMQVDELLEYLGATEQAKRCAKEDEMVSLIRKHKLEREHVPTQLLNSKLVWEALIEHLGMEAIIRNLGKITSMDMLKLGSDEEKKIVDQITNAENLKFARVHPFKVLLALNTYRKSRGDKGKLYWIPNRHILAALEKAFYLSFESVQPTGKKFLLAIDVSGSMNVPCVGSSSITCRDAAAAMMMVTVRTETNCDIVAFSHELHPMDIAKNDTLEDVLNKTKDIPFGGTDCALPMIWAQEKKKEYDVFIVYTDSETWYGKVHPSKALQDYRVAMAKPDAKLIVVGMASNGFTIADPDDLGMLDVVGFDSAATKTIEQFALGEI